MRRSRDSFRRDKARYKVQPRVLIICEDTKSSKSYLQDASQYFRANVHIEIVHSGYTDPIGIVKTALQKVNLFENVICVIDRDTHLNFDAAVALSRQSGKIDLIVSYPCFEYWLLLHFGASRKAYMRTGNKSPADLLIADLCKHEGMNGYEKGKVTGLFDTLLGEKFDAARRTSPKILADAIEVQELNPSTRLHVLISLMESLGTVSTV